MILITIYCHITKKINIIASIQDKNKYSTFKISYMYIYIYIYRSLEDCATIPIKVLQKTILTKFSINK